MIRHRLYLGVVIVLVVNFGLTAAAISTTTPGPPLTPPPTVSLPPIGSGLPSAPPGATTRPPFTGPIWQPLLDFPSGEAFQVTSVTAFGAGFVAVGFQQLPGDNIGLSQGVVWRSDDGRTWQSTADPVFQFVTPEEIVALGESLFVLGTVNHCDPFADDGCIEPPESGWAVWSSTDGGPWERLPQLPQMQSGTVDGAVAANGVLVAYGLTGGEDQPVVWTSADGATWASTTDLAEMDPVTAMVGVPTGLIAFGNRVVSELGDSELLAALSTDGAHFARASAPAPPETTVTSVVAGQAGLVAVGGSVDIDLNFDGIALYSTDGLSWTPTEAVDGSFAGGSIRFAHVVPGGYVAVGSVPQQDDFGTATGASWISTDGQSWQSLAPFGDTFGEFKASAVGAAGIVAFTVTGEGANDEPVSTSLSAWFAPIEALSAP